MKPIENRKHHYVPQMLLRNFALEKREQLHAFDKWESRKFQVAVKDAAAERRYYSFKDDEYSDCAEEFLAEIETAAAPTIQRIVSKRNLPKLSKSERASLERLGIAQMLRSKNHRAIHDQLGEFMREFADREGTPEFKTWVGEPNPEMVKQGLIRNLKQDIPSFLPYIQDKDLLLYQTEERKPLLIGDSPFVRTNTVNNSDFRGTTGLTNEGVEIYLPISPILCLGFMCRSIGRMMREAVSAMGRKAPPIAFDYLLGLELNRPVKLAPTNVDYLNSQQVISAERYVYSGSDDFTLVQEMIDSDPLLRKGARLKMNGLMKIAAEATSQY